MDRIDAMRLFVRLAEGRNFSAAAREMRVKQSTASKWIAELEEQLGVALVERTTRSFRITDAGRRFNERALELLAGFDEVSAELKERNSEPAGRIRVTMPVVFGRLFMVPLLAEFLSQHRRVEAELILEDRYVNLIEEGIDLAIRVGIPLDSSSRARKLADGKRCLVASPEYVKVNGRPHTPKDLEAHACLPHGDAMDVIWKFSCAGAKPVPISVRGRVMANNSETVLHLARSGLGIALLADWLVERDLKRGKLVRLLETFDTPPSPVFGLMPPRRYIAGPVRALLEYLAASLANQLRMEH